MPRKNKEDGKKQPDRRTFTTAPAPLSVPGTTDSGWRRKDISVWVPPFPRLTSMGALGGGGLMTFAIADGTMDPRLVWPAVVATGMTMAYDITRRMLDRNRLR
ncbi:hypothetical protein [Streptomyces sp. NBC_01167]|uniref:hypothetical protein n=1 Tax=unclassified Streptomyces TaxID=2593676 RepID=UPI0038700497|nr:hypothetical protein OG317_00305 [Streptomyces sp. NBC_01167]